VEGNNIRILHSFSVSPRLRGEMKFHGKAGECRSMVVYRDRAADVCGVGRTCWILFLSLTRSGATSRRVGI
jgi:hypothetical protein